MSAPVRISWGPLVGVGAVGAYCFVLFTAMNTTSYDVWGALIIGPLLLVLSWPIITRIGRSSPDPWLVKLLYLALILKLLSGVARWAVAFVVYDGQADAHRYDIIGRELAAAFQQGVFDAPPQGVTGTGFMMTATGVLYFLTGPTVIGGFLVFSWLSFWGLYFLYKAFRIAVPEGNHKRYARLVLLLPSMLFWPSGIGKEAWMLLCIGMVALGSAWLFTHHRFAYPMLAAGLTGTAMVRPHITLMLFAGVFFGFLFRPSRVRSPLSPVWKILGVALLVAVGFLLAGRAATFLGAEEGINEGAITASFEEAGERTDEGGSSFQAQPVGGPADVPGAAITVLFRPFPWEANNAQALLTAAEGTFLLVLIGAAMPRLRYVARFALTRPYVMMCVPYIILFIVGFANFGNFGILARQRVQVYPFLLVLVCLPAVLAKRQETPAESRRTPLPKTRHLTEGARAR